MNPAASFRQRLRAASAGLADLPAPEAGALAHSRQLIELLREEIADAGGAIPFQRYMELALYAPGLGYYSAGSHKFGAGGDFITAPEASPLFARTLARGLLPLLQEMEHAVVLEAGAGSGALAAGLLREWTELGQRLPAFRILEISPDLQQRQAATLAEQLPDLQTDVAWLTALPENFRGIVLANELLDALPVHRVLWTGEKLLEAQVTWQDGEFAWQAGEPGNPRLAERFAQLLETVGPLPAGYVTEINLAAEDWLQSMAAHLQQGAMVLIDYGFARHEFYHPQRDSGTLMCHYRHRAHGDPLRLTGLQDITAHLDFTALADAALAAGLRVHGYTTQAHFLLGSGLTEMGSTAPLTDPAAQLDIANQIRRLTLPQEMGELFKVLVVGRDVAANLPGLQLRDLRGQL